MALVASMEVRGAQINTGVEELLWPAVIVASPFLVVHKLFHGSDSDAIRSAQSEADQILVAHKENIPVSGLYSGPINLRWALYGMLAESRIPLVEIDAAGSAWLLSLAKQPQALIDMATKHKYIGLSLGDEGHPNCFAWNSTADDFTAGPPVRPGTCVLLTFHNELQSNLYLKVDTSEVSNRKLRWDVIDRETKKVLLSVPFWQSQTKDKPLLVSATYRAAHEDYTFVRVIRKLSPVAEPKDREGLPYVANRIRASDNKISRSEVKGDFRPSTLNWQGIEKPRQNERWKDGYKRAITGGKPVIINNKLLVVPQANMIGPACANPLGISCENVKNFVSDTCVLTTKHNAMYEVSNESRSDSSASFGKEMSVDVSCRDFSGNLLWFVRIRPTSLPQSFAFCNDPRLGCYFDPLQAITTKKELVLRGVFTAVGSAEPQPNEELFELAVPLTTLPVASF